MPKLSDADKIWAIMLSAVVTMILIMITHANIMNKRQHDSFALCLKSNNNNTSDFSIDRTNCSELLDKR